MQQAARVSDVTGVLLAGQARSSAIGPNKIFTAPTEKLTEDYVTGRFG